MAGWRVSGWLRHLAAGLIAALVTTRPLPRFEAAVPPLANPGPRCPIEEAGACRTSVDPWVLEDLNTHPRQKWGSTHLPILSSATARTNGCSNTKSPSHTSRSYSHTVTNISAAARSTGARNHYRAPSSRGRTDRLPRPLGLKCSKASPRRGGPARQPQPKNA